MKVKIKEGGETREKYIYIGYMNSQCRIGRHLSVIQSTQQAKYARAMKTGTEELQILETRLTWMIEDRADAT